MSATSSRTPVVGPPVGTLASATVLSAVSLTPAATPLSILVPALISITAFARALASAIRRCCCPKLSVSVPLSSRNEASSSSWRTIACRSSREQ